MEEALNTLRRLYGVTAQWRTANQEKAIKSMVNGHSQVIAILGTGEGKSLLYQLTSQLPEAATTVVLLPLVALKQGE
jgi:superfamily II DNA helicase RecQ